MKFETAVITNPGGREVNQDYTRYVYEPDRYGCWVIADGLGGHVGGEVASRLAADSFVEAFSSSPLLSADCIFAHIKGANDLLLAEQKKQEKLSQMSTTLVVLAYNNKEAIWAHLGDSRLYYFSEKKLVLQTKDHSVSQAAADIGHISREQIRGHEDRNKLFRALGMQGLPRPSILKAPVPLKPGDAFLLCTDGFWEYVNEKEMEQDLNDTGSADDWLRRMTTRHQARIRGNGDNYSALCILVHEGGI